MADGLVAEWLCRGLQILLCRFDSDPGLHPSLKLRVASHQKSLMPAVALAKVEGWAKSGTIFCNLIFKIYNSVRGCIQISRYLDYVR